MGDCALITPVYLEIALLSGARSGAQATGQVISAIDIADISIRTLREEGDYPQRSVGGVHRDFYPCPPRGGRLFLQLPYPCFYIISIHALREEGDTGSLWTSRIFTNFYPRPPRGGRRAYRLQAQMFLSISIHTLCEEGDRSFPIANSHS